jgi:hypothetical protein
MASEQGGDTRRVKIIFLDIDGTINRTLIGEPEFNSFCIAALNRIIEATGAKLVLSSSWRYKILNGGMSLQEFARDLLEPAGVCGQLIGYTRENAATLDDEPEPRWRQIADWLRQPPHPIERYCILDDDPDAFGGRPGVRTDRRTGLTEADADAAIEILGCRRLGLPGGAADREISQPPAADLESAKTPG